MLINPTKPRLVDYRVDWGRLKTEIQNLEDMIEHERLRAGENSDRMEKLKAALARLTEPVKEEEIVSVAEKIQRVVRRGNAKDQATFDQRLLAAKKLHDEGDYISINTLAAEMDEKKKDLLYGFIKKLSDKGWSRLIDDGAVPKNYALTPAGVEGAEKAGNNELIQRMDLLKSMGTQLFTAAAFAKKAGISRAAASQWLRVRARNEIIREVDVVFEPQFPHTKIYQVIQKAK